MGSNHDTSDSAIHIWQHIRSGILGVILLFSLVWNSLLMVVLRKMKSRRSKKDSASFNIEKSYIYLLLHLAIADMLGVVLNIPFDIIADTGVVYYFSDAGCKLLMPLQLASTSAQAGTYVALSYHRFRAIVYPIRANLTVSKSILMIGVIWSVGVCLSLPYVMVLRFQNGTCEENWSQEDSGSIMYTFAIFTVQYAVPVCLMAVFYINIARTLHDHRIAKELVQVSTQDDVRSHRHIVKMLVTIVTVYSVCMLPHNLIWIIKGLTSVDERTSKAVTSVSYLFTYSNCVANPIIFFSYNKESRYHLKRFCKWFCCCARDMEVPFEIKKWSATWSANSKTDCNYPPHEKKAPKRDPSKLDQLFLSKPGDSDLGVSLPWEAQINSHTSTEENHEGDAENKSPSPVPDPYLSPSSPAAELSAFPCGPSMPRITQADGSGPYVDVSTPVHDGKYTFEPVVVVENETKGRPNEDFASLKFAEKEKSVEEDEGCVRAGSESSEDDTSRVQKLIKEMMEDITHEMKEDARHNRVNGVQYFDNAFYLNDSSSNCESGDTEDADLEDCGATPLGRLSSSQDLVKVMINFLENSPHGTEGDNRVLQEQLRNLPETRM